MKMWMFVCNFKECLLYHKTPIKNTIWKYWAPFHFFLKSTYLICLQERHLYDESLTKKKKYKEKVNCDVTSGYHLGKIYPSTELQL